MAIETPTGYISLTTGVVRADEPVRRIWVIPSGGASDAALREIVIQMELSPPDGAGLATLVLSPAEALELGRMLSRATADAGA